MSTQEPTTEAGKRYAATGATKALAFILEIEDQARKQGIGLGFTDDHQVCEEERIAAESAARAEGIAQGRREERRRLRAIVLERWAPSTHWVAAALLADPEPEGAET